jgi:outer membrane protein assembly factor BamB
MKLFNRVLSLMILSGLLIHLSAYPQKTNTNIWPGFRGVNCAGVASPKQDPPVSFGKDQNAIWKLDLPEGHSSPCIWGDNIFLTGYDLEGKKLKMYCINRKKGNITWEKNIQVENFEKVNPVSNPATATATTDGERVYFYFSSYGLLCYDFNGEMKWELKIPVPKSRHGMGTSPIITGDLVILNCLGHQNDPRILAINKINGSTVWKYSFPVQKTYSGDSYSTPVVYRNQVIIYSSEDVSGYDLKTGERVWSFPIGITDAVCTPVVGNETLYTTTHSTYGNPEMRSQFPAYSEMLKRFDTNNDSKLDKEEVKDYSFLVYPEKPDVSQKATIAAYLGFWDSNKDGMIDSAEWRKTEQFLASFASKVGVRAIKLGGQGDISLNSFLWQNPDLPPHIPSPLYYNERVYTIRDGGLFSCFDAKSGKVLYREKIGAAGSYFASPVAVNGRIYVASRSGVVTVVEAGDNLKILAKNDLKELITATPAIVDSKLYLRTDKALYAFGKPAKYNPLP